MAKKQSSKTTGGTQKFGKKAAPKTYDADKKKIEAFCKRRENHDAGLIELTRRVCQKFGFNSKSSGAVQGYISGAKLVKAAAKESQAPANAQST